MWILLISAGLGLKWIRISFAISIKIASVLAEGRGIIEWLVCIMPWCWCYQFLTCRNTKFRPASLKIKGSDKQLLASTFLIHQSFCNRGNGIPANHSEAIFYDLIQKFLEDPWRTVKGKMLLKELIKTKTKKTNKTRKYKKTNYNFYLWLFLLSSQLLWASTSSIYMGKKDSHAREGIVYPTVFDAVNSPSELLVLFFPFFPSASGSY